jgi:serine/threonine-protein kinase
MSDSIPRLIAALADRYRIERELGQGGMATVYLAQDLRHHRQVAVKVLRPELSSALGPERFLREIETTANLRHPHILPLYDSGRTDDLLYYVMPFVEGESLRDRLSREKQLPVDDALRITREVADALSYAHSKGVIHRDIKPENILLESGHAVVADFGIAKAISAAGGQTLTRTGISIGTPQYMSPEQAAGEGDLDGRSDLYSLACVLYEMLAGQPPFSGATAESLVHQHLVVDARPITQLRPAVPARVADTLQRALSKTPADRFAEVGKFAEALGAVPATSGATPVLRGSGRRRPLLIAAALLIVAIGAVGARRLGLWGGRSATATARSVAVLPFVDLSGGANEYLGDGMAETLISALSRVEGLQVTARTSAFSFKGRNQDVRAIGAALGVGAVLEGSVQRSGDQLRITAHLVKTADGFDLWSDRFDRNVADVFAVQDEVARAVVTALQVRLIGDGSGLVVQEGTKSIEAYQAYLQGLFFWNKRTTADIDRSATWFLKAIAADSGFGRAWAALANAYVLFLPMDYDVQRLPPREVIARADSAARRALALDDRLASAHAGLAAIFMRTGRMAAAEVSFRNAIAADPQYPTGHQWYAAFLVGQGRTAEALEHSKEAARLDPLSLVLLLDLGLVLQADGQMEASTAAYQRLIERYPDAILTHFFAGLHLLLVGDYTRAGDLLGRFAAEDGGAGAASEAVAQRVREGIQDPARRVATLTGLAATGRPEWSVALHRMQGDDAAAVAVLESVVDGPNFLKLDVLHVTALLGPRLSTSPRVRQVIARWEARLREFYGVTQ